MRIIVVGSGYSLAVLGLALILTLPLDIWPRLAGCVAWTTYSFLKLRQIQRCYEAFGSIRLLSDGAVQLRNCDREWVPASLQNGSVLTTRIAWLLLKTADGDLYGELLCGNGRRCGQWRRLQIIWRHIGAPD